MTTQDEETTAFELLASTYKGMYASLDKEITSFSNGDIRVLYTAYVSTPKGGDMVMSSDPTKAVNDLIAKYKEKEKINA
jgi:hypothetical protein